MLCALTVRKLKPGTFEDFREAFMEGEGERWRRVPQPPERLSYS